MRTMLATALAMSLALGASAQYRIGEERFASNCLAQVSESYVVVDGALARLSALRLPTVTVRQTLSANFYLAGLSAQDGSETFAVEIAGDPLPDGERVRGLLREIPGLYQYRTVLGSAATVRRYRLSAPRRPTDAEILEAFRRGDRFWIMMETDTPCAACGGQGTLPRRHGTFAVRSPCPECGGRKTVRKMSDVTVQKEGEGSGRVTGTP